MQNSLLSPVAIVPLPHPCILCEVIGISVLWSYSWGSRGLEWDSTRPDSRKEKSRRRIRAVGLFSGCHSGKRLQIDTAVASPQQHWKECRITYSAILRTLMLKRHYCLLVDWIPSSPIWLGSANVPLFHRLFRVRHSAESTFQVDTHTLSRWDSDQSAMRVGRSVPLKNGSSLVAVDFGFGARALYRGFRYMATYPGLQDDTTVNGQVLSPSDSVTGRKNGSSKDFSPLRN
jgi:hypothetical protein